MVWLVFTVPFLWAALLGVLSWLEMSTLAPEERAAQIHYLLGSDDPDDIETQVAELLAPTLGGGIQTSRWGLKVRDLAP